MDNLPKNDENQLTTSLPEFIVIKFSYSLKIILPREQGMKLIDSFAGAIEIDEAYGKAPKIKPWGQELGISYLTNQQLNEMRMASILQEPDDAD